MVCVQIQASLESTHAVLADAHVQSGDLKKALPCDEALYYSWDKISPGSGSGCFGIPGFGSSGAQLYFKSGCAVTATHSELALSEALNYMRQFSLGTFSAIPWID